MKKYEKVEKKDYVQWHSENKDYRERVKADPMRLEYHLMPETGWLNDPNGLCQLDGVYHIYYQYTPFEPTGEVKLWGHYTTRDFIRYTNEEPALFPDQEFDAHGVYSGSAFVKDKTIHYFYTGNVKYFDRDDYDYIMSGRGSNTIHCTSKDGFGFTPKELVMENRDYPSDMSCHVRDPKIYQEASAYYMVLGGRDASSKGLVLVYRSEDLENWTYHNRITTEEKFGYMWECPDLFQLDDRLCMICCPQGVAPDGVDYNNVHQCVVMGIQYDFEKNICHIDDGMGIRMVDRGFDFYAPQTFLDEQGRRILIGWMGIPDAEYTNPTVDAGWQHALTMPRELRFRQGRLIQQPIEEMKKLRKNRREYTADALREGMERPLVYEVEAAFSGCAHMWMELRRGAVLSYDGELLTLDVSACGSGRTSRSVELAGLDKLQIFSDTTSLEIFVNGGEEVFTSRVYGMDGCIRIEGDGCQGVSVYELDGFAVHDSRE